MIYARFFWLRDSNSLTSFFQGSPYIEGYYTTVLYSTLYSTKSVLLMKIYIGSERGAMIDASIKMRLFFIQTTVFVVIDNNDNNHNHHYCIFIYIFIHQQPSILTPHASFTTTTTIFYVFTFKFHLHIIHNTSKFLYQQ